MEIELVDYDPDWPRQFVRVAARIRAALGASVLSLEHVGSTAVPGLAAKPIVDVALVVHDSASEHAYAPQLESAGFALTIREPEWFEHRLFDGRDPRVNLHVFSAECPEVERMVRFRNWLRREADDRALYEKTKRGLAAREWAHVQNYADAKSAVIGAIMVRASA